MIYKGAALWIFGVETITHIFQLDTVRLDLPLVIVFVIIAYLFALQNKARSDIIIYCRGQLEFCLWQCL